MRKRGKWLVLAALCVIWITGCRQRVEETEEQTQPATVLSTEAETEKTTEKATEKPTEKESESETKTKTTVKHTTVKPSTTGNNNSNSANNTAANTPAGETKQCPYCYQQISTAPDGNGSTIYDAHVAQEKNWADLNGYGDTPPASQQSTDASQQTSSTEAQQTDASNDTRQCGYCYQWFTVSDGSYAAHVQMENQSLGLPENTEYIVCPKCGNAYPAGSLYDNHVCVMN